MPQTIAYGPEPEQFGELTLPAAPTSAPVPVVALFHGGSFETQYTLEQMRAMAADLAERGIAAWNLEFRRLGSGGEGTVLFADARAGLDHLVALRDGGAPLDLDRVAVVGLSSGSAPALHVASAPAGQVVRPVAAVNQAGWAALAIAAEATGAGPALLLGGLPADLPEVYAEVDPAAALPLGVPLLHVHGTEDASMPLAYVEACHAAALAAGDDSTLAEVPGGHVIHQDPSSQAWRTAADWLQARLG